MGTLITGEWGWCHLGRTKWVVDQAGPAVFFQSHGALIAGMLLAKDMGAKSLMAKSDSLLEIGKVTGEYQAKNPQMIAYLLMEEYLHSCRIFGGISESLMEVHDQGSPRRCGCLGGACQV